MIARLPVPDFAAWHAEYERMHPVREQAGERGRTLYRDVDDPEVVVVVFAWDSVERAKAYFGSAALQASVGRAGATSAPEVTYLRRKDH